MAGIETIGAVPPDEVPSMTSDGDHRIHIARATYSFAEHGGAFGAPGVIQLGVFLPDNAVVVRSWFEVTTAVTSGGAAQIALSIIGDDVSGIIGPAVLGTNGTAGYHEGIQTGTSANFSTKTTAERELSLDITVANLDAGVLILFCEYVVTV